VVIRHIYGFEQSIMRYNMGSYDQKENKKRKLETTSVNKLQIYTVISD
jgi:hypothetical protein